MARPRIKQFAGDLGISYDEANNLIKKGRRRTDGGSHILEKNMNKMSGKVKKVSKALKKASKTHAGQAKTLDSIEFEEGGTNRLVQPGEGTDPGTYRPLPPKKKRPKMSKSEAIQSTKTKPRKRLLRAGVAAKRKKTKMVDGGSVNMSRGGGAAIQGTKFTGVK